VTDRNGDELMGAMQADLMPHVHAVRHLLPLLQDNVHARRYVMIGSPANARAWAGYGETSITTAALRMYAQVVHQEAQALGVRADAGSLQPGVHPGQRGQCLHRVAQLAAGRPSRGLAARWLPRQPRHRPLRQQRCRTAARPAAPGSSPCGAIPQASLDLDHG
jgi:NAD(P)-dependent dehydrogenase (short-subunit alcohol dehydrogenase family)